MIYILTCRRRLVLTISLMSILILLVSCGNQSNNTVVNSVKTQEKVVEDGGQKADNFEENQFISNFVKVYIRLSNNKTLDYSYLNTFLDSNTDVFKTVKENIERSRQMGMKCEVSDLTTIDSDKSDFDIMAKIKVDIVNKEGTKKTKEKEVYFKISNTNDNLRIIKINGDLDLIN